MQVSSSTSCGRCAACTIPHTCCLRGSSPATSSPFAAVRLPMQDFFRPMPFRNSAGGLAADIASELGPWRAHVCGRPRPRAATRRDTHGVVVRLLLLGGAERAQCNQAQQLAEAAIVSLERALSIIPGARVEGPARRAACAPHVGTQAGPQVLPSHAPVALRARPADMPRVKLQDVKNLRGMGIFGGVIFDNIVRGARPVHAQWGVGGRRAHTPHAQSTAHAHAVAHCRARCAPPPRRAVE